MLATLHTVLVALFVTVTVVLLGLTVMQRIRIRRVRMVWRSGRIKGLPIWPILFTGVVAIFLVYAQNMFPFIHSSVFVGYLVGGVLWFVSVMISSTSVVTDYGIIPEVGRSGEAVAWGQISDYFEVEAGRKTFFVFMYQDFLGARRRLEVSIPAMEVDRFRAIIRSKLDVRIEEPVIPPEGKQVLRK